MSKWEAKQSEIKDKTIGIALTGSFCTYEKIFEEIEKILLNGANVVPIMSEISIASNTRFGAGGKFSKKLEELTGNAVVSTIKDAEPIGPSGFLDILVIAPCTGNTAAKLAHAITDTCVTMAAKAHLRNNRPLLLGIATNDGLGASAKNIGALLSRKDVYFVPFGQDDCENKPNSLIFDSNRLIPAIAEAMNGCQIQPIIVER